MNTDKYKQNIFDLYSKNIDILKSSIIYDCAFLFKKLESIDDKENKSFIARTFSEFLWNKYIMGREGRDPENGLVDLVGDDIIDELLMNTANYFDFVADDNNEEMIKEYKSEVLSFYST